MERIGGGKSRWYSVDGKGSNFLGRKKIDRSTLTQAISFPEPLHERVKKACGFAVWNQPVDIWIADKSHEATLIWSYSSTGEQLKLSYHTATDSTDYDIQQLFPEAYEYVTKNPGKPLPDELAGYLDFYVLEKRSGLRVEKGYPEAEPETNEEARASITKAKLPETDLERLLEMDDENFSLLLSRLDHAGDLQLRERLAKVRKGGREVFETLKERYDYTCQACSWQAPKEAGAQVIEVHHLRPFVTSLDNSPSNLTVLCPNCHALVHASEAEFNHETRTFVCKTGYRIPLKSVRHPL